MLHTGPKTDKTPEHSSSAEPDVAHISLGELISPTLVTELSRSMTRARVQQYQRYFADADRVLILLHNGTGSRRPGERPGASATCCAGRRPRLSSAPSRASRGPRTCGWRTCWTSTSSRSTPASFQEFERIATVDVQPHYFGGMLDRADLVIDDDPEQPGYSAVFKDIRADYGSTCTILTEHLRAVDVNISERTATAMLTPSSRTRCSSRHTNRVDLEAFTFLYPLADAALIRKMEGAEITLERLAYVTRASQAGVMRDQVFSAFIGEAPREDFIPYTADFFLQLEDVKWTIVAGVVSGTLIVSVRNLGTRAMPVSSSSAGLATWGMRAGTERWPRPSCPGNVSAPSSVTSPAPR